MNNNLAHFKKFIILIFYVLLTFCLICILILYIILKTNFGLKFFILRIPVLFNNSISVDNLKGNFLDGFNGENWQIKFNNYTFHIDNINLKQKLEYKKGIFRIKNIIVNNTNIQYNFSEDKSKKVKFPSNIGLPVNLEIENINFNLVTFGVKQEVLLEDGNIYYSYNKNKHELDIKTITTAWGNISGNLNIINQGIFPVNGNFHIFPLDHGLKSNFTLSSNIDKKVKEDVIDGYLYLSGSLKELIVNLHIIGVDLVLDSNMLFSFYEDGLNKIKGITFYANKLNPKTFINSAPIADLSFNFILLPSYETGYLDGNFSLENYKVNYINRSGIPIKNINSKFFITDNKIIIPNFDVKLLRDGKLNIKGKIDIDNKINLVSKSKIAVNDFLTYRLPRVYEGDILVLGTLKDILLDLNLASKYSKLVGALSFKTNKLNQIQLFIKSLELSYFEDEILNINGNIGLIDNTEINAKLLYKNINPANISNDFYQGNLNGTLVVRGNYINDTFVKIDLKNSTLSNNIFKVNGDFIANNKILKKSNLEAILGENTLNIKGKLGKLNDKLLINIKAPKLYQIGLGFAGSLETTGYISEYEDNFQINLLGNVSNMNYKNILTLNKLNYNIKLSSKLNDPLNINIQGNNLKFKDYIAKRINLINYGTLKSNNFFTDSDISINNKQYIVKINSLGGFNNNYNWNGQISTFDIGGNINLKLQNKVNASLSYDDIKISPAVWNFMGGRLDLETLLWERGKFFISKGKATNISLIYLNKFFKMPFEQNVSINSKWDFAYSDNARGSLNISRISGDINFPRSKKKVGLSQLDLNIYLNNNTIKSVLVSRSNYFVIDSNLSIDRIFGSNLKNSTILGNIKLDLSNIRKLNFLFPVDTVIGGNLSSEIGVNGTLGDISLSGPIKANDIIYHNLDSGIFLKNGTLDAYFDKQKIIIKNLEFNNSNGRIYANGYLGSDIINSIDIDLDITSQKYILYNRSDRKVFLTGKAKLKYNNIIGFSLVGDIKLDESNFSFPKSSMPSLGEDVVIVDTNNNVISKNIPLYFDINIDLNDNFKFSGKGLSVTMGGNLHFISSDKSDMNLVGNVNVIKGSYKFYGQGLKIESGRLIFNGPISNPNINFKALRDNSPVGAGIKVIGSLNKPSIELIANQSMSDADKLSWLILGRASSGESDDQALAISMGMLVAGGINEKIGLLSDISIGGRQTRNTGTGELNPAEQIITIGRNITKRIYLGYEYGLTSTSQAAKIIYQISRSIQFITRAGTDSINGEARYSVRFD